MCGFVVVILGSESRGGGWVEFPLYSTSAAFLTSLGMWWLIVSGPGRPGFWRGAVAGFLSGLLAHPVTWHLFICTNYLFVHTLRPEGSAGGESLNPLNGLLAVPWLSFWSLLIMGWFTIPAGAFIGGIVGAWQGRACAR